MSSDQPTESRMFQVHEADLAELERILPMLEFCYLPESHGRDPLGRTLVRRVQTILSNVRWNYGPHDEVERHDA